MEIFGNPITGYPTEYYLEILENHKKNFIRENVNSLEESKNKRNYSKPLYNPMRRK